MRGVCFVLALALATGAIAQGIIPGIADRCFEPKQPGICRAFIPAFYFNPLSGACDCFVYGGCRGNLNRFATLKECTQTCSVRSNLQYNTPNCDRILGERNPLLGFPHSPHQPGTVETVRAQTTQRPTTTQAATTAAPTTQAATTAAPTTQATTSATPTQRPIIIVSPQEPATQAPTTAAPAVVEEEEETRGSAADAQPSGKTKSIASIIIGGQGSRPGFLSIGQPVSIPSFRTRQPQQQTEQQQAQEQQTSSGADEELEE